MKTLLLLLIFFSLTTFAQQKTTIPFQLTEYNNLSVKAVLNQKDTVQLMFHTAANAVTLTEEVLQKITSLKFDRTDSVKSWGGNDNTSRFSKSNTLQIGSLKWENVPIWENKNSGQHTDGKFGLDLFENKTIEIDFDKKILIIYASLPSKTKRFEKLKLSFQDEMMFVEGNVAIGNNYYKNKFLIHSGYAGAILFDDQFVATNKLGEQLKVTDEKQLKDSFGNILKTKKAIISNFSLGKIKLNNIPVGFFEGALGRQKMSIIGGDIIKRFNIIIDAKREFIYLKANKLKGFVYSNV
ncbi:hypothetical protein EZ428_00370 [Pedobacter frigiditerrae]|uniref:Aspartyl protease n=1 Tax=Pedobacter frigiditerrae TaxID=2530452 RepID=A0A4R0N432_9SPHI|nr:retropepsin-like aspartic protease [Pedobacter frigiditerrae]TCC93262.1 hypothetical protein EZ428_00370 [Pedobacter frigiditerrae]